jgi:hypothetical protein
MLLDPTKVAPALVVPPQPVFTLQLTATLVDEGYILEQPPVELWTITQESELTVADAHVELGS